MKKLLAILGALSLATTTGISVVACGNTKPKQINLENYLAAARQEAQEKHLTIDEAIKQIQAISELPQGVVKVVVSKASDSEIKLQFEVSKGYAAIEDIVLVFTPIKKVSIADFKTKVKNLVEYKFKSIEDVKREIVKLAAPAGVVGFEIIVNNPKITISFKVKPGYMEIPNLVFTFLPVKDANPSDFINEVNKIVNRQFKAVKEAITKINTLDLPTGVKTIAVTNVDVIITIEFTMEREYLQLPNETFEFLPIQEANLEKFTQEVDQIVNRQYETVAEAITKIREAKLPTGVKGITVTNIESTITVAFEMEFGYVQLSNQTYQFLPIQEVDTREFANNATKIVNRQYSTVAEAITKIEELSLPVGVKAIAVTNSNWTITVAFTVKTGYSKVNDQTYEFLPIQKIDTTEFAQKVDQIVNRQYKTVAEGVIKIKELSLPVGVKTITVTNFELTITVAFEVEFGYVQIANQTYKFLPIREIDMTTFVQETNKIVNRQYKTVEQAVAKINELELPIGVEAIKISNSTSMITIIFTSKPGYVEVSDQTYEFLPIREADISAFTEEIKQMVNRQLKDVDEALDKIRALELPTGVKEIDVICSEPDETGESLIIVSFEMEFGYVQIPEQNYDFYPIQEIDTAEFANNASKIVNRQYKTVEQAIAKIKEISLPIGIETIAVTNSELTITVAFTSKPGYVQVPNQTYEFLPIQEANLEKFTQEVDQLVNRQYKTVDEAVTKIREVKLPTGVKGTTVTNIESTITVAFEMEFGYVQLSNQTYQFLPIRGVDISLFDAKAKSIVNRQYKTIGEAVLKIQGLDLPTGVKTIDVTGSGTTITVVFTVESGYILHSDQTYEFLAIQDVDITTFTEEANKIVNRQYKTIEEAIAKIKELSLPTGVKSINATNSQSTIIVAFEMEFGYVQLSNQSYQFLRIQDVDTSQFQVEASKITNRQYKTIGEAITKIKQLLLPTGVNSIVVTSSNSTITVAFTVKTGYSKVQNQTYEFFPIQEVDTTAFSAQAAYIANEHQYKTIGEAVAKIKELPLPTGVKSIVVTNSDKTIYIAFTVEPGYVAVPGQAYNFYPIRDVDTTAFSAQAAYIANEHQYKTIGEAVAKIKELALPTGVKSIVVTNSDKTIYIAFTVEPGYVAVPGQAYNFYPIRDVDTTTFVNEVNKIVNRQVITIEAAITKIKAIKLPVGVKTITATSSGTTITIVFVMKQGYVQVEPQTYQFVPIKSHDVEEINNYVEEVQNILLNSSNSEFTDDDSFAELISEIKLVQLPKSIKDFEYKQIKDEFLLTLVVKEDYEDTLGTWRLKMRKTVDWSSFKAKALKLADYQCYDIDEYYEKIFEIQLPVGVKPSFTKYSYYVRFYSNYKDGYRGDWSNFDIEPKFKEPSKNVNTTEIKQFQDMVATMASSRSFSSYDELFAEIKKVPLIAGIKEYQCKEEKGYLVLKYIMQRDYRSISDFITKINLK
ncbi:lipoprotein [Mesoplasma seiffertii]|uniref:lipoprotein n=1 Tax=Mesoplasma seiffertii TaxID=28224 RepID=UPI00047CAB5E|nr:lipoprotein [Mesoplasma seiffertii]